MEETMKYIIQIDTDAPIVSMFNSTNNMVALLSALGYEVNQISVMEGGQSEEINMDHN